jgi:hypothetical protein
VAGGAASPLSPDRPPPRRPTSISIGAAAGAMTRRAAARQTRWTTSSRGASGAPMARKTSRRPARAATPARTVAVSRPTWSGRFGPKLSCAPIWCGRWPPRSGTPRTKRRAGVERASGCRPQAGHPRTAPGRTSRISCRARLRPLPPGLTIPPALEIRAMALYQPNPPLSAKRSLNIVLTVESSSPSISTARSPPPCA